VTASDGPRPTVPPPTRRERLAWCGFDFANSSFTTAIVTVGYPYVFTNEVVGDPDRGAVLWLRVNALSLLVVLFAAPILGAWADLRARKKRFLFASSMVCIAGTAALSWCGPGAVLAACICFAVANVGFATGENLVAGFLPELAPPEEMGRLSGLGWSIGYFGGLCSLLLVVALDRLEANRWMPVAVAAFFLVAALPTFVLLRERATPRTGGRGIVRAAFRDAATAWRERRRLPDLFRLLWSLFFTQAGVATVVAFAALYAKEEYLLSRAESGYLFIGLQFAAAGGAFIFGRVQDRIGSRRTLFLALATWMTATALAVLSRSIGVFCVAAALTGAAMGGSQSAGRAMVGLFTPRGREGAWFGLWGVATKAAAVVGLVVTAALLDAVGRRTAMASLLVFFSAGALVLVKVNEARGRAAARIVDADRMAAP
jgi:MFS transporter, UMF1 family